MYARLNIKTPAFFRLICVWHFMFCGMCILVFMTKSTVAEMSTLELYLCPILDFRVMFKGELYQYLPPLDYIHALHTNALKGNHKITHVYKSLIGRIINDGVGWAESLW
jgi:hypothetical protein